MTIGEEPLGPAGGFLRLRGGVSYDGSGFSGWGLQPDRRTVQGDLEGALMNVLRAPRMHVQCAGRTDAGVHATGQVFHVDVPAADYPGHDRVRYRLNSVLADDVVVTDLHEAAPGFDARFAALSRTYEYLVNDGARQPLLRGFVYHHGYPVDVELMNQASRQLLGLHDFTSYCKPKDYGTTIRDLQRFDWDRRADGLIVATVTADAFCYSMVRMLVGALLDVGAGRRSPEWLTEYLESRQRESGVFVAPAHGLTLTGVEYPPDDELAARQERTKRLRASDGTH